MGETDCQQHKSDSSDAGCGSRVSQHSRSHTRRYRSQGKGGRHGERKSGRKRGRQTSESSESSSTLVRRGGGNMRLKIKRVKNRVPSSSSERREKKQHRSRYR